MSLISLVLLTRRAGALDDLLPCQREDPELWFSEQPADLEQAKTHCRRCPVRGFCLSGAVAVSRSAIAQDLRGFDHAARCWKTIVGAAGRRRPMPGLANHRIPGHFPPEGTPAHRVRPRAGRPFPSAAEDST